MKLILSLLCFLPLMMAETAITRIHVTVGPCLDNTCSRKVNLTLKTAGVGFPESGVTVVMEHHGVGYFDPKVGAPTQSPEFLEKKLKGAGLALFSIGFEVPGNPATVTLGQSTYPVNGLCAKNEQLSMWKRKTTGATILAWIPKQAGVCRVP